MDIKLAYITDLNYTMPTMASIASSVSNMEEEYKIYVITTFNNLDITNKFLSLGNSHAKIIVKPVNPKNYIPQNIISATHVSTTALIKFFLPNILKDENKVIYIDGDTIIQKPLCKLYNTNIKDYYAGAVFDSALTVMPQHARDLNIPPDKYFNSGMMLLNLDKMRNCNISEKLLEYKLRGQNFFMDQDAFNKILYGNIKFLPGIYNTITSQIAPKRLFSFSNPYKEAVILHFADSRKPWIYQRGILSKIFKKYYKLTPCNNVKLKLKNYNNILITKFIKALIRQQFI